MRRQKLDGEGRAVGHVMVTVTLRGLKGERRVENVLVDTGATWTVIPPEVAEDIGVIEFPWEIEAKTADGRTKRARAVGLEIQIGEHRAPTLAVVLEGSAVLVGVRTLEDLGLKVNPVEGKLEPTRPLGVIWAL